MGCIRNLGCLIVLAILVAVGWLYRERWMPSDWGLGGGGRGGEEREAATGPAGTTAAGSEWEPLTAAGAARTRAAVDRLARRSGPVFANLQPADAASYILEEISAQLLPSAENVAASVIGDRLFVRADVKLSEFGGSGVLGPLASVLGDDETIQFGGTVDVIRPGLAEYRVRTIKVRDLSVPSAAIPRIMRRVRPDSLSEVLAADAVPVQLPPHIGDIRIGNGKVTLYKAVR